MSDPALDDTYLSRHPVLDLQHELFGYELRLQTSGDALSVRKDKEDAALLICSAYAELGIRRALGRKRAFLRIDQGFLHDDAIEALPADCVVLQIAPDRVPDATTLERCRALRDRRYSLALADYTGLDERSAPLLTMVDLIGIDIRDRSTQQLLALAGPLKHLPLKLLAQRVETQEAFTRSRDAGFQLFQGNYFAHPEVVSGRRLSASQTTLIELINLANRDADTVKLEEGIKHDAALTVNLLSIVNSVGFGMTRRISSLRHAITILGRRQLQRWLQLLLMTPAGKAPDPSRIPLLQVAALRGRMLELLVGHLRPRDATLAGQAFITGIMSMMPAALGLPMDEIFEQIALEHEIIAALQSYQGILGKMLALIECYDAEDIHGCDEILAGFLGTGLDRHMLNTCLTDSLRWINGNNEIDQPPD
ncbi:EAL and HDOD domain-containing protein [Propionivibrio sp.]|uniref:EAL and HDOD domain-containing protein n=1 Tax=Propionivibrio sp. TaxID=2212460 RepID=UPI00272DFFB2|nr:HDOD domain-containing protein [Propionivibrio sp.]